MNECSVSAGHRQFAEHSDNRTPSIQCRPIQRDSDIVMLFQPISRLTDSLGIVALSVSACILAEMLKSNELSDGMKADGSRTE